MKGLLLSGGTGSRLRPLTYSGAKQLIPVANKPILFYAIEAMKDAGITDIGVVVGNTRTEVQETVGDGSRWGVTIRYIPQDEPRGLAHAVAIAQSFIQSDPFLMFLGDNLLMTGVKGFVEAFRKHPSNALLLLSEVNEPQRFGVARFANGSLVELIEKPKVPPSNFALVGIYIFDATIFNAVKRIRPSWRNELEITDAIQQLINDGKQVHYHQIDGWWKDTGKPEDVLEANRLVLDTMSTMVSGSVDEFSTLSGRVIVDAGATIINSVVRGPVVIGKGARIDNAYVGPFTAIGPGVTVCRSEIEDSIVMEDSILRDIDVPIDHSLIGRHVVIASPLARPAAIRLIVGDDSTLELR